MEVKLFTNEITINSNSNHVKDIIVNIENLLKWNHEISDISSIDNNQFIILRRGAALNKQEIVSVYSNNDIVSYVFTTGTVEYRVDWLISQVKLNTTRVSQTLYLKEKNAFLPIAQLIKPITQNAFRDNLSALRILCEQGEFI
ncbi:hypothetical protein [Bombilactobacillus thymidiniphilus]|uniref:Polyketide cyclase/dehydrase/lipid transport protein n=1 Tax=Bombilactobacillus thymidiniphilus TaxID=2923363 RepID=A0ABY4PD25_9LACO|nr:hypothetical protein [Bombilactobacillus thymidiniphilus]UQS83673.1 hypothetical protein MOO47_00275 [Bombilactobacillus thymidiniphilus]